MNIHTYINTHTHRKIRTLHESFPSSPPAHITVSKLSKFILAKYGSFSMHCVLLTVSTSSCTRVCMYACMHVCMYVCMYVRMYQVYFAQFEASSPFLTRLYTHNVHIHTYTHVTCIKDSAKFEASSALLTRSYADTHNVRIHTGRHYLRQRFCQTRGILSICDQTIHTVHIHTYTHITFIKDFAKFEASSPFLTRPYPAMVTVSPGRMITVPFTPCVWMCTYVCMYVCVCMCTPPFIYVYIYIYIYTHTHTHKFIYPCNRKLFRVVHYNFLELFHRAVHRHRHTHMYRHACSHLS
jgi:hypothetical protein